ncbi:MAG: NAD-binding protein, partial [Planctomycetota bacterium]|nr:NAD-binding protein [Planctomycetota bacterium]
QGVLILGAHSWARAVAAALKEAGFEVLLADTNRNKVRVARMEGLDAHHGSVLAEEFQERVDLGGKGRMLALTSNSGVNSLAALELAPIFGRSEVYQLCADSDPTDEPIPPHLRGRLLFDGGLDFWEIDAKFRSGYVVKRTNLTDEFDLEAWRERYGEGAVPLFSVRADNTLRIFTAEEEAEPKAGEALLGLVPGEA